MHTAKRSPTLQINKSSKNTKHITHRQFHRNKLKKGLKPSSTATKTALITANPNTPSTSLSSSITTTTTPKRHILSPQNSPTTTTTTPTSLTTSSKRTLFDAPQQTRYVRPIPADIATFHDPLHVSSQIHEIFPYTFIYEVGFDPTDPKHANPQQRLGNRPGLWGLKGIKNHNELDTLYLDKVQQIESRAATLLETPTTVDSLQLIDDMSKLLCDIADLMEAIRVLHQSPSFQRKSNSIHEQVQTLLQQWSSSPIVLMTLYNIVRTKDIWDKLPLEGRRIVLDLVGRMNMNALVAAEDYMVVPSEVYRAEEEFGQVNPKNEWISISKEVSEGLSASDRQLISSQSQHFKFKSHYLGRNNSSDENQQDNEQSSHNSGKKKSFFNRLFGSNTSSPSPSLHPSQTSIPVAFRNDEHTLGSLLNSIQSKDLRKLLYKFKDSGHTKQLEKLQNLIKYRHIFGLCQGHLSYAHSVNASQMSKVPIVPVKAITTFLDRIAVQRVKEYKTMANVLEAIEDVNTERGKDSITADVIKNYAQKKKTVLGNDEQNQKNPKNVSKSPKLFKSDIPYVMNQVNRLTNGSESDLRSYLRLDSVLQGIGLISNVMDVRLEAHLIRPGEGWGSHHPSPQKHDWTMIEAEAIYGDLPQHPPDMGKSGKIDKKNGAKIEIQGSGAKQFIGNVSNSTYHAALHKLKQPGTWCHIEDIDLESNHHLIQGDCFKLHLIDKTTEDLLGVLYIDPYTRHGKYSGGAQYIISLGRMSHERTNDPHTKPYVNHDVLFDENGVKIDSNDIKHDQSDQNDQNGFTPTRRKDIRTKQEEFDLPVTVLTTSINVSPPSIITNKQNQQVVRLPLLTGDHMRLLFHEVGHAYHAILNRTQFQHYSGPRCEMDFVETPSTLFETLGEDARFINMFARHHITGDKLPKHILDSIDLSGALFPAQNITQTGVMALVDLKLFGPDAPITNEIDVKDPFKILKQLANACEENNSQKIANFEFNRLKLNGVDEVDAKTIVSRKYPNLRTKSTQISPHKDISYDNYRPLSILTRLYKDNGHDIGDLKVEEAQEGSVMQDILSNYTPSHSTPAQTTLQTHAIYRRYANIDLHEDGPGVIFDDVDGVIDGSGTFGNFGNFEMRKLFESKKFELTALKSTTKVMPQASHTHLSHYGGFYFSYIYCRAFALLVKKNLFDPLLSGEDFGAGNVEKVQTLAELTRERKDRIRNGQDISLVDSRGKKTSLFDQVFPTTKAGVNFRRKVLQLGGSQVGFDILGDFLALAENNDVKNQNTPKNPPKSALTIQRHDWPDEIFALPYQFEPNQRIRSVGVLLDSFLNEEQLNTRSEEMKHWVSRRNFANPNEKPSMTVYPPHTEDITTIYGTLTQFQQHVGWKVAAELPNEEIGQNEGSNDVFIPEDSQVDQIEGGTGQNYGFEDSSLTSLQQKVLELSFHVLEQHVTEQSEKGLKHIHDKLGL
jgi:Zn-dependent oligopeptidase